jgi:hypothetical protein
MKRFSELKCHNPSKQRIFFYPLNARLRLHPNRSVRSIRGIIKHERMLYCILVISHLRNLNDQMIPRQ